ncbi:MAG TPA: futalosine hydrolase [Bacteroidia bacterium]|jgi:futalosine hydrolase|nr:futalosine hydrolase [Bacteroidia bacterium]
MNILIVSATKLEIASFLEEIGAGADNSVLSSNPYKSHKIDVLITGVGIAQTGFYLGKYLSKKYDLVINAGICGSFNRNLRLGEVVNITEDYFADLGAEDDEKFLSVSELSLPGAYYVKNETLFTLENVKQVRGVTVNTTHGSENSIKKFTSRIKADTESMEGAAFLWACNNEKVKCIQLRSVSNYVEKRDRSKWEIAKAINSLNEILIKLISIL